MGSSMNRVPLVPTMLLTGLLSTGATLSFNFYVSPRSPVATAPSSTTGRQQFGLNEYTMLKTGMSLTEVRSILGKGTELESTANSVAYKWKNDDNSSIYCYFKEGKLERKKQSRLS
jgi:hypothetical protein